MKVLLVALSFLFIFASDYKSVGEYTADSKKEACDKALIFAKEDAMQQAGTFVSSQFNSFTTSTNAGQNFDKSNKLKQFSQGMTKLISKNEHVTTNDKTYQFTCKIDATFSVEVDKIKDFYEKSFVKTSPPEKTGTLKNGELEVYKLNQKIVSLQNELNTIKNELAQKQDDTAKKALLHGMLGIDSQYGMVSGARLTFGLLLNKDVILKFGSGGEKALIDQTYNTLEILDFSLTDNNSIYSYFYGYLGGEYFAFRYKDYFLTIGAGIQMYDTEQIRTNKTYNVTLTDTPSKFSGNIGLFLGFSYYKFGIEMILPQTIGYSKNGVSGTHKSSPLKICLSLAVPIDIY